MAIERLTDIAALRARTAMWRAEGHRIALVPTMGNLHEGHLALVRDASRRADRVLVSIFVNPLQFGAGEDYESYPRTLDADVRALETLDLPLVLFTPTTNAVYPDGPDLATRIIVSGLSEPLCGEFRPAFFSGVATVVAKLLNMSQPDAAVFGRKDYQQLQVVRRMVRDLNMPVEIVGVDTVREPDGLAMSSRNSYLDREERACAPVIYGTLRAIARALRDGSTRFHELERMGMQRLREAGLKPEYVSIRNQQDLAPAKAADTALVILAAAWLGRARLIDNVELRLNRQG